MIMIREAKESVHHQMMRALKNLAHPTGVHDIFLGAPISALYLAGLFD